MAELVETRWRRYGKDRVYVKTSGGIDVGYVDLVAGRVEVAAAGYKAAMAECARRWLNPTSAVGDIDTTTLGASESRPTGSASDTEPVVVKDYAFNVAGAAAWAKREQVNAESPKLNLLARVLGVKTPERAWRVGAKGEARVAGELARLPADWRVLHAVEVGERGSDIDHVVIGPAGVFTLNTKRHPGGNVWVNARLLMVNGQRTSYLRNSTHEAGRTTRLLTKACGRRDSVRWFGPAYGCGLSVALVACGGRERVR
jgi:Nuclease-related domain